MQKKNLLEFFSMIMEAATSDIWVATLMQFMQQTSKELYIHSINVALISIHLTIFGNQEKIGIGLHSLILGALLHDIGYVGTVRNINGKPRTDMTAIDKMVFEIHIHNGIEQVKHHTNDQGVLDIIAMHHEYVDGSGFPNGLKNEEVPPYVRIVSMANNLDNFIRLSNQNKMNTESILTTLENAFQEESKKGRYDFTILNDFSKNFSEYASSLAPFLDALTQFHKQMSGNNKKDLH